MAFLFIALAPAFCLPSKAASPAPETAHEAPLPTRADQRIVILAPAAADIVNKLGLGPAVVGKTNRVEEFPHAVKIGTHRNPGIENIAALNPTLLIAPARFDKEMATRLGATLFAYEPHSLPDILNAIHTLGNITGQQKAAHALATPLSQTLDRPTQPNTRQGPTALYETRSTPLSLAARDSFIASLLASAGFTYAYQGTGGEASAERVIASPPDFYIYQVGPMNKKPTPPDKRPGWAQFGACVWKVDELTFARANTESFALVEALRTILDTPDPCAAGKAFFEGE